LQQLVAKGTENKADDDVIEEESSIIDTSKSKFSSSSEKDSDSFSSSSSASYSQAHSPDKIV
jgi:hypothetical protein